MTQDKQDLTNQFWEQLGIPTATLTEARNVVKLCFDTGMVPCLVGEAGIGKTQLMQQVAKDQGWEALTFFLAHREKEDIIGIPFPTDDQQAYRFLCEESVLKVISSDKPSLIVLDEFNRGDKPILNAAFTMIESRKFGTLHLPPQVHIAACMNPSGGSYTVSEAEKDPAFRRRLCFLAVQVNVSVWVEWALGRGKIHPDIIDFIRLQPQFLNDTAIRDAGKVAPNPASWEKVSDIQKIMEANDKQLTNNGNDERMFRLACAGYIGLAASDTYITYKKDNATMVNPSDILMRYNRVQKKVLRLIQTGRNDSISELYTAVSLTLFTDEPMPEKCCEHLGTFFGDLPPDMAIALFQQICAHSHDLGKEQYMQDLTKELITVPAYKQAVDQATGIIEKVSDEAKT